MFTDISGTLACLSCGANAAVMEENNLRYYYETKHQDKLKKLNAKQTNKTKLGSFSTVVLTFVVFTQI